MYPSMNGQTQETQGIYSSECIISRENFLSNFIVSKVDGCSRKMANCQFCYKFHFHKDRIDSY